MTRVWPALLAALLVGCASPKYNYRPVTTAISEPPIGSVSTARIGDTMLRQGRYTEHEALYLPGAVEIGWAYTLLPGYFLKIGEDSEAEFFSPDGGLDGGRVQKSALADPWKSVMTKKGTSEVCVVTAFNVATCTKVEDARRTQRPVLSQDSIQRTLLYNGKVGNKINIGYREFSSNMARPAFNNNVEYDLSESNRIGYKGAELDVIEATNQHIKFRLIRNFNTAD